MLKLVRCAQSGGRQAGGFLHRQGLPGGLLVTLRRDVVAETSVPNLAGQAALGLEQKILKSFTFLLC